MSEVGVDKAALRSCARKLGTAADNISALAREANGDSGLPNKAWGILGAGLGLEAIYLMLVGDITDSINHAADFMNRSSLAMDHTAKNYHAADAKILAHIKSVEPEIGLYQA